MPTYEYIACLKINIKVIVKNVKITFYHLIKRKIWKSQNYKNNVCCI